MLLKKLLEEVNQELGELRSKFYKTELLYIIWCLSTVLIVDSFLAYVSLMCQIFPPHHWW